MNSFAYRALLALGLLSIGSVTWGDEPPPVVGDVQVVLHREYAAAAAFTPDGKRLFVSTDDAIFVWDIAAQRKMADWLKSSEGLQNLAISPDGQCLVAGSDECIATWDLATVRKRFESREKFSTAGNLLSLAFAPDGRMVAAGNRDGELFLWDVTIGKPMRIEGKDRHSTQFEMSVKDLAFLPDGRTLAVAREQSVSFWDLNQKRFRDYQVRCPYHIDAITLSPDGKTLVAVPGETLLAAGIDFWDTSTGKSTECFQRYVDYRAAAFSSDGRWLATGGQRGVDLWDLSTRAKRFVLTSDMQTASVTHRLVFSPDSRSVCAVGADSVRLWRLPQTPSPSSSGHSCRTFAAGRTAIRGLAFDAGGATLLTASADGEYSCRKTATGETFEVPLPTLGEPTGLALSPDGSEMASWGTRGGRAVIEVWNRASGTQKFSVSRPASQVLSAAYRPDGRQLAFATDEGEITLIDPATGQSAVALQTQGSEVWSVAFSPNGGLLASAGGRTGSGPGQLSLWDLKGNVRLADLTAHVGPVYCTVFSQSGAYLFSAGADGIVRVWDVGSRALRGDLKGHRRAVFALAVRRDGLQLASGGADRVIRLWALDRVAPPMLLSGSRDHVESLSYSFDGKTVAAGAADGLVNVWDLPPDS